MPSLSSEGKSSQQQSDGISTLRPQLVKLIIPAFALTLAIWLVFYVVTPSAPLNPLEAAYVFGLSLFLLWGLTKIPFRLPGRGRQK